PTRRPTLFPYTTLFRSNGITALKYARDRHSFAASDLTRITDQQSLVASLLQEAISSGTLANPLRLSRFLAAVPSVIKVDQNLDRSEEHTSELQSRENLV